MFYNPPVLTEQEVRMTAKVFVKGWKEGAFGLNSFNNLPTTVKDYLHKNYAGIVLALFGNNPTVKVS